MYNDICGPNSIATPPLLMMPFRHLSAWLNLTFPDPLYVRTVGVFCAIIWAFMFRALIGRVATDRQQRDILSALAFGLLGFGLLPWFLVLSRPEHPILLTSTGALLIATIASQRNEPLPKYNWAWPLGVALLGMAAMSYHMKGVLFLPVFLACAFFAGSGRQTLPARLAAMLLLTLMTAIATQYWIGRFSCPSDPVLAARFAQHNISSVLAEGGDWKSLVPQLISGANPNQYIFNAEARPFPLSQWLPDQLTSSTVSVIRFLPMAAGWNIAMLAGLVCLFFAAKTGWRSKNLTLAVTIAVIAAGLVVVWGMSQLHKNDYEATTILPLLAVFMIFAFVSVPWVPHWTRRLGSLSMGIAVLSVIAQIDIAFRYGPALLQRASMPGYVEGQKNSASVFGYNRIQQQIRTTARQCGIGSKGRAQHPLVDDVTYFAMQDSYQPFHRLGVLSEWNGSIRDPIAYLRSRGSEGMILGCRYLDPNLKKQAISKGEFCCIPIG
jgi:hypothetical protein